MVRPVLANRNILLIAALLLTSGLVVGGYLLGDGLRRARMADRAVTMRGLAERDVTADLATWSLNFTASSTDAAEAQAKIDRDQRLIQEFIQAAGFPASVLSDGGGSISSVYDADRQATVTTVTRSLSFRTNDVMRAQRAYASQFNLIRNGVQLDGSGMNYTFTRLNAVKPEMIGESIQDARRGAERFATDSGAQVGAIRSATQGYFSIGARDGGDGETDGGSGSTTTPLQKVRVVTTIEFYLGCQLPPHGLAGRGTMRKHGGGAGAERRSFFRRRPRRRRGSSTSPAKGGED